MWRFIKKTFPIIVTIFNLSVNSLECILMNNQKCKANKCK